MKKLAVIANERKLKVVNDIVSHRGSNFWVGWIKMNFSNFNLKQKQTNVWHFVTDGIIKSNSKKMSYNVKKSNSFSFWKKIKSYLWFDTKKNYVDCFLKSTDRFLKSTRFTSIDIL